MCFFVFVLHGGNKGDSYLMILSNVQYNLFVQYSFIRCLTELTQNHFAM